MSFGKIIKKLRIDLNMTQEKLAELIGISPQAISRWETDIAMPDISLLPPLANLFNVTTDYLLGMDNYQKDLRKKEYDNACFEYWKNEDKEKNYLIAKKAVKEYPNNMEYVEWLASSEYCLSFVVEDSKRNSLLDSSINHYNLVIENSKDSNLIDRSLNGIVYALTECGRFAEAKDYANKQKDTEKRNKLLFICLDGKDKVELAQKLSESLLNEFVYYLKYTGNTIKRYELIENILSIVFPDGNYQYYHNILQYNSIHKSFVLCNEKKYDEAIKELQKARFHAEEMVKYNQQEYYSFTTSIFNMLSGAKEKSEFPLSDIEDFINCLNNNSCYDSIKNRDDFKELLNK